MVTADGTYATQSALLTSTPLSGKSGIADKPALRRFLLDGEFFLAAALGTTLSKLVFRFEQMSKGICRKYIFNLILI